jgi:hypothetical protein
LKAAGLVDFETDAQRPYTVSGPIRVTDYWTQVQTVLGGPRLKGSARDHQPGIDGRATGVRAARRQGGTGGGLRLDAVLVDVRHLRYIRYQTTPPAMQQFEAALERTLRTELGIPAAAQ